MEPANHTAWVDRFGDTWVRADDMPGAYGSWWPLTSGPGWNVRERGGIGTARTWDEVVEYGPFTPADDTQTAAALARVQREVAR